ASGSQVHFFVIGGDGFLYEQICEVTLESEVVCPPGTAAVNWHLLGAPSSDQRPLSGRPSAAAPLDGAVAVAAAGAAGTPGRRHNATGSWGDWTMLSDMVTPAPPTEADSPGLGSWGGGRLDIFVRTPDGLLAQMGLSVDQSGMIQPSYWAALGGLPVSGVTAS